MGRVPGPKLHGRPLPLAVLLARALRRVAARLVRREAGSVGIDKGLLRRTDILPGEQVSLRNVNNGQRIETYAIELPEGSGQIVVNGAAARHFHAGDKVIIVAFCLTDEAVTPRMITVDGRNRFTTDLAHGRDRSNADPVKA